MQNPKNLTLILLIVILTISLARVICQPPPNMGMQPTPPYTIGYGADNPITTNLTFIGNWKVFAAGSVEDSKYMNLTYSVYTWTITPPPIRGYIRYAYLYIARGFYDTADRWTVLFDSVPLAQNAYTAPYNYDSYIDVVKIDVRNYIVYGYHTYNITIIVNSGDFIIYCMGMVVISESILFRPSYIWLNDGNEWIYNAISRTNFTDLGQPDGWKAKFYVFASGGEVNRTDNLYFDGNLIATNPFNGSSGFLSDFDVYDVTGMMGSGSHYAEFQAFNDGITIHFAIIEYVSPALDEYSGARVLLSILIVIALLMIGKLRGS